MNMPWLTKPVEFSKKLNAIKKAPLEEAWGLLMALSQTDLNFLETIQIDKVLTEKFGGTAPLGLSTQPVRLAILSSSTVDQLLPGLRVGGLRRNLWISTYTTDYGQSLQEMMNPLSGLHQFKPTAVLVAFDAFSLFGVQPLGLTLDSASAKLEGALDQVQTLWRLSREKLGCHIIQQTPLPLYQPLMGHNEQRLPDSPYHLLRVFNAKLRESADEQKVDILDINSWAAMEGLKEWHNPVFCHQAKQEVSPTAGPMYGELVGRLLAAQQGRSFKCLVLDLDQTLWGGVIGDDGLEGIQLGQGSGIGEAFSAFQRFARDLSSRGVILAVCSKNNEAAALEPFDKHPEMILKRDHIAYFAANWNDKASNLKMIAKALNIGLDAMVFVDDNPFERNQVRSALPMVAVPEMPEDAALYPACLVSAGYFEAISLTEDDRARSAQYQANHTRIKEQGAFTDLTEYLKSLDMELVWGHFDGLSLPRVTQLINKSNQFNLTTRRYSEEETKKFATNPKAVTLRCRLIDRFGDNGIIGIMIAVEDKSGDWLIDTWLMSCRVLGRGVEQAMMDLLAQEVSGRDGKRLIGLYCPTAKNEMVKDHYAGLGFEAVDLDALGNSRWALKLESKKKFDYFVRLEKDKS
ncbi:MAG TPA: HAD-IIIC family phosphatase [bacterium]|nr:HAD-IIIC family phosphatase [bacterium]